MRVVIHDVTIPQALDYKKKLEQVDGVDEINWLDDVVDIYEPLENADTEEYAPQITPAIRGAANSRMEDTPRMYSVMITVTAKVSAERATVVCFPTLS